MVVVTAVVVTVAVVVMVKVLVWVEAIVNMVVVVEVIVIGVLADVGDIVMGVIVIVLTFVFSVSYPVGVSSSDVAVDLFMDALTGLMLVALSSIGVDVLANVNLNRFAVLATSFEFSKPGPLEEEECRC